MAYQEMSQKAILQIMRLLAVADGQPRGQADEMLWLGVARENRWRPSEVEAAITTVASRWTGEYARMITPGVITAEIRALRSHEPPIAEQMAAWPVVEVPPEERRRELAAWLAGELASKKMPEAHPEAGEADPYVAGRRAGWTPPDWAAVSSCAHCDEQGMRRDAPDLVCSHPRTGDVPNQGCDTGVGSGAHPTTEEETDHDSS